MTDWNSPEVLASEAAAFLRLQHVLAGLYFWEFAVSFPFDWKFISGKQRFRWPLIFYFAGRYCLLFAMVGLLVELNVTSEIDCKSLLDFLQFAGNAAVGLASINLAIRTMAIWAQTKFVVIPLVILILGHWTLIFQGVAGQSRWVDGSGCVIISTNSTILSAMFIYSMTFDFIVLALAAYKLYDRSAHSQIVKLLFHDGLVYFTIAFMSNIVTTTFMLLNLNSVMNSMFNVPAATASTVVACRVVRRLFKYTSKAPQIYTGFETEAAASKAPVRSHIAFAVPRSQVDTQGVEIEMSSEVTTAYDDSKYNHSTV
ncbi:hypothetical protein EIP91_012312 [Steccherinum ochraceum]|uniref:Transmembrane protein n=1 Tax=Steccherinum ochraceum TaxID=92696 RepID=A0A4V2MWT5_9APHY|nr:hypothetical protein EIP91_012312 [Steccherinum ochraceum]